MVYFLFQAQEVNFLPTLRNLMQLGQTIVQMLNQLSGLDRVRMGMLAHTLPRTR